MNNSMDKKKNNKVMNIVNMKWSKNDMKIEDFNYFMLMFHVLIKKMIN